MCFSFSDLSTWKPGGLITSDAFHFIDPSKMPICDFSHRHMDLLQREKKRIV